MFTRIRQRDRRAPAVTLVSSTRGTRRRDNATLMRSSSRHSRRPRRERVRRARPDTPVEVDDTDLRSYRLLYRNARTFAAGHGCSVDWEADTGAGYARSVRMVFIPRHALPLADSNPAIRSQILSFQRIVDEPKDVVIRELHDLFDQYGSWISEKEAEAAGLPDDLRPTSPRSISPSAVRPRPHPRRHPRPRRPECLGGVPAREPGHVEPARAGSSWLRGGKPTPEPDVGADHTSGGRSSSRSSSCASAASSTRAIRDRDDRRPALVPHRRRQDRGVPRSDRLHRVPPSAPRQGRGRGVTVLMRYTLRLLTIQQFERAAALLIALLRGDPAGGRTASASTPDLDRPLGRAGRHAERRSHEARAGAGQAPRQTDGRRGRTRPAPARARGAARSSTTGTTRSRQTEPRIVGSAAATRTASSRAACRSTSSTRTSTATGRRS